MVILLLIENGNPVDQSSGEGFAVLRNGCGHFFQKSNHVVHSCLQVGSFCCFGKDVLAVSSKVIHLKPQLFHQCVIAGVVDHLLLKLCKPFINRRNLRCQVIKDRFLNLGNASGKGMITTEGFVLFAGAVLNEKTSEKSLSRGAATLRKKHLASNKVKDFVTTEDILFSSSSAAADFVTGYSVSGPATWKNAAGVTLKELEAKATK